MDKREHTPHRTRISLQGGGRFEEVTQIVDVKLDPGDLTCRLIDDEQAELTGEVRAYLYFRRDGDASVSGEGIQIPFTRNIDVPRGIGLVQAAVADIDSKYEYDPETGQFQHFITLEVALQRAAESPGEPASEEQPEADASGSPEDDHRVDDSADEELPEEAVEKESPTVVWDPFPPPITD